MVKIYENGRLVVDRQRMRPIEVEPPDFTPDRFAGRCVAVTSMNPASERMARQIHCIESWQRIGLPVVVVNTAAELRSIALPTGVRGVACERVAQHYDRPTQLVSSLVRVGAGTGLPLILINSDIEISGRGGAIEAALDRGEVLTIGVRHNHRPGDSLRRSRIEPSGLDVFGLTQEMAATIPDDAPFGIGKPAWDYWLPEHFRSLGYGFHWIRQPMFFHESHPLGWTHSEWEMGRDFIRDRYGVQLGYGSQEFRRGLDQHRLPHVGQRQPPILSDASIQIGIQRPTVTRESSK